MMSACLRSTGDPTRRPPRPPRSTGRGAALTAVILFIVGLAAAISVDVVRDAYDIKGDESTYVAMTLSLAHDGDLSYQRGDLERFWGIYKKGPEGIFSNAANSSGSGSAVAAVFPVFNETPEPRDDRLYFAKAMIYPSRPRRLCGSRHERLSGVSHSVALRGVYLRLSVSRRKTRRM